MRKFILLILISGFGHTHAQSLESFIQESLENNYDIRITRTEADIARNNNTAGNAGFLPVIDAGGQYSISESNTEQNFFNGEQRQGTGARNTGLNGDVSFNWRVFDGLRMFANRDRLSYLESIGDANVRFFIDQTVSDIASIYYEIIKEYRVLEILRSSLEVSRYRFNLENARKKVGAGTALDYNQALVDYRSDSSLIINQKAIIRQLEIELNRIANHNLSDSLTHDNQIPLVRDLPSEDELTQIAIENNQNLEIARLNELVAESDIRFARADHYPMVDIFSNYTYNRSTSEIGFVESNRSYGPQLGVRVRMNLYNGGNVNRQVRNAEMQRDIALMSRESVELNVQAEILQQITLYKALIQRLAVAESNVVAAGKALDVARAQLNEGEINGIDFRVAQVTLISVQNNREQILYSLKAVEITLLRLMGRITNYFI